MTHNLLHWKDCVVASVNVQDFLSAREWGKDDDKVGYAMAVEIVETQKALY